MPPFPVLFLALPLQNRSSKSMWGLGALPWHPPEIAGCYALPPQTTPNLHGPTVFRWSCAAVREPCQVRGAGNIYLLYSSSMSSKWKDGLCLPGAAWREPGGNRGWQCPISTQQVGKASTRCAPSLGRKKLPRLGGIISLAWEPVPRRTAPATVLV